MPTGCVGVVGVELGDGHDPVVELDAEHRVGDRADVAHGLLRRLRLVREHVHLDGPIAPVADHPDGVDARQPAQLVLEVAEQTARIGRVGLQLVGHRLTVRPLGGHRDPPPGGPPPPPKNTAYGQPTTLRGAPRWLCVTHGACVTRWFA